MKVLIVEDDPNIRMVQKFLLSKEGFSCYEADRGGAALEKAAEILPDIIILDIQLPEMDGYSILKEIKGNKEVYGEPLILMLTSKGEREDVIKGLTIGADDYVKKPFDDEEFILRVRALMRRVKSVGSKVLKYKELIIDTEQNRVIEDGKEIKVTKKEILLMELLINNKGIVLSRDKIAEEVWGEEYDYESRAIDNFILRMKKKINIIKDNLEGVKGIGYKLQSDDGYMYR